MNDIELTLEGLVHDLNNVFQTIGESAEVLRADPKWAKLASTVQRSVDHGQGLAHSILEKKRSAAEPKVVVETAIQFAGDYLECVHGPEITFTHEIEPLCRLVGDPAAWERVLVNLFLNAAEAGATRVNVRAELDAIVVSDDGPGIPADLLPRIFQPHVSTKSIFAGLGLYVVQSIVEQHGGAVSARNRPGGGAEFRISL
jgi:signal transduction histidine kinase